MLHNFFVDLFLILMYFLSHLIDRVDNRLFLHGIQIERTVLLFDS